MEQVFAAIDLSGASAAVIALMVVGVGIAMAFKAGALGKRAVNKA